MKSFRNRMYNENNDSGSMMSMGVNGFFQLFEPHVSKKNLLAVKLQIKLQKMNEIVSNWRSNKFVFKERAEINR